MKKIAVYLIIFLCVVPLYGDNKNSANITYGTYINARYQFEVKYPKELLFPSDPPDNNDGRSFDSKDKQVYIAVQGSHLVVNTWQEEYEWWLEEYKTARIDYKVFNKKFFIISGYDKDKVFYVKQILVGTMETPITLKLEMQYPQKDKAFWDSIASICSKSLQLLKKPVPSKNTISGLGKNFDQFK